MRSLLRAAGACAALAVTLACAQPAQASAQGRGKAPEAAPVQGMVTLSVEVKSRIQDFYAAAPESHPDALPPGIRKNLARGKPLPPGIAKKTVPAELRSAVTLPGGYELVEVGLDVLLVEVATGIVHDVLMDIVR